MPRLATPRLNTIAPREPASRLRIDAGKRHVDARVGDPETETLHVALGRCARGGLGRGKLASRLCRQDEPVRLDRPLRAAPPKRGQRRVGRQPRDAVLHVELAGAGGPARRRRTMNCRLPGRRTTMRPISSCASRGGSGAENAVAARPDPRASVLRRSRPRGSISHRAARAARHRSSRPGARARSRSRRGPSRARRARRTDSGARAETRRSTAERPCWCRTPRATRCPR